jgi:hypothetical protein
MISPRFVRAVSLLTVALFLFSASVNETLHRLEISPPQSQLVMCSPSGRELAIYHGDLPELRLAALTNARPPGLLHRLRETVRYQWL